MILGYDDEERNRLFEKERQASGKQSRLQACPGEEGSEVSERNEINLWAYIKVFVFQEGSI